MARASTAAPWRGLKHKLHPLSLDNQASIFDGIYRDRDENSSRSLGRSTMKNFQVITLTFLFVGLVVVVVQIWVGNQASSTLPSTPGIFLPHAIRGFTKESLKRRQMGRQQKPNPSPSDEIVERNRDFEKGKDAGKDKQKDGALLEPAKVQPIEELNPLLEKEKMDVSEKEKELLNVIQSIRKPPDSVDVEIPRNKSHIDLKNTTIKETVDSKQNDENLSKNKNPNKKKTPKKDPKKVAAKGPRLNEYSYETLDEWQEYWKSSEADPSLPTVGFLEKRFYSGFRNQAMVFIYFCMMVWDKGMKQILIPTIRWKDLYGTNKPTPHEDLFDVVHWNSVADKVGLPKMVRFHPDFVHYDNKTRHWLRENPEENSTMPFVMGRQARLNNKFRQYTKQLEKNMSLPRHPVELAILRGALRPKPSLQRHMDRLTGRSQNATMSGQDKRKFLCLHGRVEPDMQRHTACKEKKVIELQSILESLEKRFPKPPPFSDMYVAINRPLLDNEAPGYNISENLVALENKRVLDQVREQGLWSGSVKVHEGGAGSLKDTAFEKFSAIAGAVADYFIAVTADRFVGTPVSSFSTDIVSARFYKNSSSANHFYLPEGVEDATTKDSVRPPRFGC